MHCHSAQGLVLFGVVKYTPHAAGYTENSILQQAFNNNFHIFMENKTLSAPVRAEPVDPWAMQRTLMQASGQPLPAQPQLNNGVVLYAALNLEEGAEILRGLVKALQRLSQMPHEPLGQSFAALSHQLSQAAGAMQEHSLAVRNLLKGIEGGFERELSAEEVIEMADGTTDLTVTNCGFALSLGLDGAACYREVADSNLSKRNPDTGRIDKTPDGKWIKGRNYREPDLTSVIWPKEA